MVPHGLKAWPVKKLLAAMKDSTHCTISGRHGIPLLVAGPPVTSSSKNKVQPGRKPNLCATRHYHRRPRFHQLSAADRRGAAAVRGSNSDGSTARFAGVTAPIRGDRSSGRRSGADRQRPRKDCQPAGRLFDSRGGAPLGGKDRDAGRRGTRGGTSKRGSASRGLLDFRPLKERSK